MSARGRLSPPSFAAAAVAALILSFGCSRSALVDCRVPCTEETGCPQGLSCSNGFCSRSAVCDPADAGTDIDPSDDVASDTPDVAETDAPDGAPDLDGAGTGNDGDAPAGPGDGAVDLPPEVAPDAGPPRPSDLPGLVLWLDATDLQPGSLGVWPDKSGLAHDGITQPDGKAQVVVDAYAGLPAVDMSTPTDYLTLAGDFENFIGGLSIFMVLYPRTSYMPPHETSFYTHLLEFGVFGTNDNSVIFQRVGNGDSQLELFTALDPTVIGAGIRAPESVGNYSWQILEAVAAGGTPGASASGKLLRNGTVHATGSIAVPNLTARRSNFIGAANLRYLDFDVTGHYRGRIAEVITYARDVTDAERIGLERYLSAKWHITLGR